MAVSTPTERDPRNVGPFLRRARTDAGLRQVEVVEATSLSQAQLSRVERSDGMLTKVEQARELAALYRLDPDAAEWLEGVVEDYHSQREDRRFYVLRGSNIENTQRRFRRLEQQTTRMRSFSMGAVLGQVQTAEMIAAIFGTGVDSEMVHERRRRGVDQPSNAGRRYEMVMGEGVCRWLIGSLGLMADQLDHLVRVSHLPNVDLRWVPGHIVTGVLPSPGFHIYDDHTVGLSQVEGSATLTDSQDLRSFVERFEAVQAAALAGDDARAEMTRIADGLGRTGAG